VTVEAEVSLTPKHHFAQDMSMWSTAEVYQWFLLKKLPVRGLLELQANGADLQDWVWHDEAAYAPSKLSALPPHGLGM
jgi:hypothetical protein